MAIFRPIIFLIVIFFCISCQLYQPKEKEGILLDYRDMKLYKTIQIGNQIWMKENLAYKPDSGKFFLYHFKEYIDKYGYLYDWETAKTICPCGWHLPSKDEYKILLSNIDTSSVSLFNEIRSKKRNGFNALYGGSGDSDGTAWVGTGGFYWTSTNYSKSVAYSFDLLSGTRKLEIGPHLKSDGLSVRCIEDNFAKYLSFINEIYASYLKRKKKEIVKLSSKSFVKRYFEKNINISPVGTVVTHNKIVALTKTGDLYFFNLNNFEVDTIVKSSGRFKDPSGFYQVYDSLILVFNGKDYYLNKEFKYIPYERYKNCFYKRNREASYGLYGNDIKYIDPLYCDKNFIVTAFCAGEFGGTVYFFDLKEGNEYACSATCGVIINKVKNKYIMSVSLNHMGSHADVIEVEDPRTMIKVDFDTLKNIWNFWENLYWNGDDRKYDSLILKSRGKNRALLDSTGINLITAFTYKNDIYYIYKSFVMDNDYPNPEQVYLGKTFNNRLEATDSLGEIPISSGSSRNRVYDSMILTSLNGWKIKGFILIKGDTINIVKY